MPDTQPRMAAAITHRSVLRIAWPIILANTATPLLGLADTAVIGNFGSTAELAAIALGSLWFMLLYWSFGFLRMGTSGFTAQADGAGNSAEVRASLGRALLIAWALGLAMLTLQIPILGALRWLFSASSEVETIAAEYFRIRLWAAPAHLGLFALFGVLVGLGESRTLMALQLGLNGSNILLDVLFAGYFQMGAAGIALGTAIAEYGALGAGLIMVTRLLARQHPGPLFERARILDTERLAGTLKANTDILIRTFLMLLAFAWFTNQGARLGDATLAANHVLLQLIMFSAFFMDGFAFAAESLIGRAVGAGDRARFERSVRISSQWSALTALALAATILIAGDAIIALLTDLPAVRDAARLYLLWCALYVACSFAAFQFDGIFIGATRTRDLRNAAIISVALFAPLGVFGTQHFGNHGLWASFVAYVLLRAVTLWRRYPALRAEFSDG